MSWIVFTYSLPSKSSSSPRVTLWRRLRRIGAIALNGVQILPDREDCLESFQWLVQEVRQAKGEALLMRVQSFEGMSDQSIIQLFCEARQKDYSDLETKTAEVEEYVNSNPENDDYSTSRDSLAKLYKQYEDIRRIDFFNCPEQEKIAVRLKKVTQTLLPVSETVNIRPKAIEDYRHVKWLTRPKPHVDRLACIWLIRRFINSEAHIRYGKTAQDGEITFDMSEGDFQHQGNLCTFEVMVQSFGLEDLRLQMIGEIVHEIDLRDGLYLHPQMAGVDTLLRGWLRAGFSDTDLESYGIALFDGLYSAFEQGTS